ncbi:MAG: tetratricopeptide repeat protein [Candidatus Eisenbacteria bacterium]|nr:tetratricopeptide repeat protein [Candidatus Eisenbacteria bacterium]
MRRHLLILLLAPCVAAAGWNGGIPGGYLRFGASARSLSMGGLDLVLGHGEAAAYGNPAQVGLLAEQELSFTHVSLYEGASYTVATAALPGQSWGGLALAVVSLGCDGFERRGELDNRYSVKGEEFGTTHTAIMAGGGQDLTRFALGSSIGGRVKLVAQSMLDQRAFGFGADLGFEHRMVLPYLHRWIAPLTLSWSASNVLQPRLRMEEETERFARRMDVGASYDVSPYGTLGLQARLSGDGSRRLALGVETWPREELAVRLGGNDTELTAGVGLRWKALGIDYGIAWHEEFSSSHRLSLVIARPRSPGVSPDGTMARGDASRWVVQHYRDTEAAHLAHRLARLSGGGRAARLYHYVIGEHPATVWAAHGWRWFGDRAYDRDDWGDAERDFTKLLHHAHRDEVAEPATWFRLGDAAEHQEHWRSAVDGYELVMSASDQSSWKEESFFRAGAVYFLHLTDYPAAVRVYEQAVGRYPARDLSDAYFRLGRSYAGLERWQTCVERMDTFLGKYPGDSRVPQALFWSGRALYELGLPEDALPRLERVVEGYPRDDVADDAILFKGHCRRLTGDLEQARIEYARVVKDFPSGDVTPLAQLSLGVVLQEAGSRELAAREFQRFIANYPTHPGRREAEDRLSAVNR